MTVLDVTEHATETLDLKRGAEAARLIWDDNPEVEAIVDPRTPAFAHAMIDTSVEILGASKGLIKRMINQAAVGAEGLAVAQFQGITEIIQNADDVRATEVRFALRDTPDSRQLLIVHNGKPVTCHNVLGMALPYLTTKATRTDQRGRFGIGMKTLNRIANSISIHSSPYHFSGNQLNFDRIDAEAKIPDFYTPARDTMVVVDLNEAFEEGALVEWFDAWQNDGLLFLTSVSCFRWCDLGGATLSERTLSFLPWVDTGYELHHPSILSLKSRDVDGPDERWTVWQATVEVPADLHPAHKARNETTDISIAVTGGQTRPGLFIGFRTQVPLSLIFSLDAQFDPSTSRETIIENPWNSWLIDRACEVVADVAAGLLSSNPKAAWQLIPIKEEHVGKDDSPWLRERFAAALDSARDWLCKAAVVALPGATPSMAKIVYESEELSGLLKETDIEHMATDLHALHLDARDKAGRWRQVLGTLNVSTVLGTDELLEALGGGVFSDKAAKWWVEAGARLVAHHPDEDLFGKAFLLSERNMAAICEEKGGTNQPLVFDTTPSAFAVRWKLLERLHLAYGESGSGTDVIAWLSANAAFTSHLNEEIELAAFAEHYEGSKIEITDEELRDLRACFDSVSDRRASKLGVSVGNVLLLDGHVFKSGKQKRQKVVLSKSYLCKTLDGESATWPHAAGSTSGIQWIAAKYEKTLKTNAKRWAKRKREDGSVSRGARRFLTLLGAEVAPRILRTVERVHWGEGTRLAELRQCRAEQVEYDLLSPDLVSVLNSLQKLKKPEAKLRSRALLRTFSRNWDRLYNGLIHVPAEHLARIHTYSRGEVAAAWLNELQDTPWIAVGRGELVEPRNAVVRTLDTQTLYSTFACNLAVNDVHEGLAAALHLITDVRIGDLLAQLEKIRDTEEPFDYAQILHIYRTIAKRCPQHVVYDTRIGEITIQQLRARFLDADGLICVGNGDWQRPDQVMRGPDIFHKRRQFVPGGVACIKLWVALGVLEPNLTDCIQFCRDLAEEPYEVDAKAALMDVYRYMEGIADAAERKHSNKLRNLPLYCGGEWISVRPVFYVENTELRNQLVANVPWLNCWIPPYPMRDFPNLARLMVVEMLEPELKVEGGDGETGERGEQTRVRFGHAVDHLSAELARSEPATRDRIAIDWGKLKDVPLFVYDDVIAVRATSSHLPAGGVQVSLNALVLEKPYAFYFREEYIGDRDFGGRLIASLFPPDVRRRIDGEWVLAWQQSMGPVVEEIRLASDDERDEAMQKLAGAVNAGPKGKIKVTPPKSRNPAVKPRTLKESVGAVVGATVQQGKNAIKSGGGGRGLASKPPEPSGPNGSVNPATPMAFTNADLEQRGWEILVQALEASSDQSLVDFRNRHGVGADGVFDWKIFVEMKATARKPQTQVELTNNEFERAKQRGNDFILALVSGLESGYRDEVRLIFDPANCVTVRPTNGMKLVSLLEAPAVIIHFEKSDGES